MNFILHEPDIKAEEAELLATSLNISSAVASVLISRGFDSPAAANKFLNPSPESLHSYWLLPDIKKAVDRLLLARDQGETVLIHGDYDTDGITSTALLYLVLKKKDFKVKTFIPNRLEDDFGFNEEGLEFAKSIQATLVVTCDCGTTSVETVTRAREMGIDVIVTDHHQQSSELPDAVAVVNPNRPGSEYPFNGLAGVGVAGKFIQAVMEKDGGQLNLQNLMRIVSIGTIADIMPLVDENRYIAKTGLETLHGTNNVGLKELIKQAGLSKKKKFGAADIGFRLSPRINAAGRLGKQEVALELLTTNDKNKAFGLARQLESFNSERQQIVENHYKKAHEFVQTELNNKILVTGGKGWHTGILGLVASSIVKEYNKPAFVYSIEEDKAIGSARSIDGIHLLQLMHSIRSVFTRYGGHAQAAGFEVSLENLQEFKDKLRQIGNEKIKNEQLLLKYTIDAELSLNELTLDLANDLALMEPFGIGNPAPLFVVKRIAVSGKPYVIKDRHLKFNVIDDHGDSAEILFWGGADRLVDLMTSCKKDLLVTVGSSIWHGKRNVQVVLKDFRDSGF